MVARLSAGLIIVAATLTSCVFFELPAKPADFREPTEVVYAGGTSFWSETVAASGRSVDPDSDAYIERLASEYRRDGGGTAFRLVIIVEGGSVPIYEADSETPRFSVPITTAGYGARGVTGVPVPAWLVPDSATDGHVAIIDRDEGVEYDFWQLRKEHGRWVASAAALLDYTTGAAHADRFSVAASGFPLAAGLVWPDELTSATPGAIDHALVFACSLTRLKSYVAPATRSDGWMDDPEAMPMGALLRLDPGWNPATDADPALTRPELRVAEALQTYGAYLYDTGSPGSVIELNAVNPRSFATDPYIGLERYEAGGGYIDIGNIPVDRLQVMELGTVETWGESYPPDIAFEERYYGVQ
jgi:hypothetical protein